MACPDPAPDPTRGGPVLVTGIPRSGTTWLARELAASAGAAMPGREPMNPRGGQFALGGTLSAWTVLEHPSPRQTRLLRRCYAGREPRTLSRYGIAQWRAALPGTRTVVKDPFALLSVPAVVAATGAVPVVVYRSAGAQLVSYRRMGWTADTAEVRAVVGRTGAPEPVDDVEAMAEFWTLLHGFVLDWLPRVPGAVLVSHAELSLAGPAGVEAVRRAVGLRAPARVPLQRSSSRDEPPPPGRLHGFDRSAAEVADGWRDRLPEQDARRLDEATQGVHDALAEHRLDLSTLTREPR